MDELPLFPLRTVLFPDGLLELKIFEARYLDLVSRCLREQAPFGVVALRSGGEARTSGGEPVEMYEVGTLAALVDVDASEPGILFVRCRGGARFALRRTREERDGLWLGEVEPIAADAEVAPSPSQEDLAKRLADAIAALAAHGSTPFLEPHRFDSAGWVANRWCEILDLPLEVRQRLMTLADPRTRLGVVASFLRARENAD
jgi:Lon protease-like protein